MRYILNILFFTAILLISCKHVEMEIDPYLKDHSVSFPLEYQGKGFGEVISFGHFSSYYNEFGLAWMNEIGIAKYFDEGQLLKFSTANNDNYTYDNVISPVRDASTIISFARKFNIELEQAPEFDKAWLGYLYAPHDEYAMIFFQLKNGEESGYLSNGFEQYEILPVMQQDKQHNKKQMAGYQFKLNGSIVGSFQHTGRQIFRMTNEYCDATEIVLAAITSSIIKCNKI